MLWRRKIRSIADRNGKVNVQESRKRRVFLVEWSLSDHYNCVERVQLDFKKKYKHLFLFNIERNYLPAFHNDTIFYNSLKAISIPNCSISWSFILTENNFSKWALCDCCKSHYLHITTGAKIQQVPISFILNHNQVKMVPLNIHISWHNLFLLLHLILS